jgi:hypothetical protein
MKASELRIGNYLQWNNFTEARIMNCKDFFIVYDSLENSDGCIEPIPLTEEWLFKFGFKKNQRDIRFKRLGSIVLKSTEKGFKFNYRESITYIHFVHQLQNLYFALNGVELTLKN